MGLVNLEGEGRALLSVFLLMVPAAFYIMGLMEGRKGRCLFLAGFALHALGILYRGVLLGRPPLAEKYDNVSFMAFSVAAAYLFVRQRAARELAVTAMPLIAVLLFVALGFRQVDTVSPFMDTPWFYLHAAFYFAGYGLFGLSSAIGVLYLVGGDRAQEALQYRAAAHGWVMLSISLLAGSVWFHMAYGTYWLWTSKELWITVTWLYYGLYLHARLMGGLKGRPAAAIGVAGFAVALFTYFGVGTVIKSPPTQF